MVNATLNFFLFYGMVNLNVNTYMGIHVHTLIPYPMGLGLLNVLISKVFLLSAEKQPSTLGFLIHAAYSSLGTSV